MEDMVFFHEERYIMKDFCNKEAVMKKLTTSGLLVMAALALVLAIPSDSSARGGHGAGLFFGGIALGTVLGSALNPHVYYRYPEPVYVYPAPPYAYPDPPAPPPPAYPSGEWVVVPGQWVDGQWVPEHKVWVRNNP
jgi:hypothetical protein